MKDASSLVRTTLWLSFPFNLVAAYLLAVPTSPLGEFVGLTQAPHLYTALLGFLVGLFGFAYAWLARQVSINRPLLALAALGKSGVFIIVSMLWLSAEVSGRLFLMACGDLALAAVWFWWLATSARGRSNGAAVGSER